MLNEKFVRILKFIFCFTVLTVICGTYSYCENKIKKAEEILASEVSFEVEDVSCKGSKPIILDSEWVGFELELQPEVEKEQISDEHYELICRMAEAETSGNFIETMGIAATVMNRKEYKYFPEDISEIIFGKGQFNTAKCGVIKKFVGQNKKEVVYFEDVKLQTKIATKLAIMGFDPTECVKGLSCPCNDSDINNFDPEMYTEGALYFYSDEYLPEEEKPKGVSKVKYGGTVFYNYNSPFISQD